jgi:hypothetical protein
MDQPMKRAKLPRFQTLEELARFWDANDSALFQDELCEVAEPVFKRDGSVQVTLASDEVKALDALARAKGVTREQLIRKWVLAQLPRRSHRRPTGRSRSASGRTGNRA